MTIEKDLMLIREIVEEWGVDLDKAAFDRIERLLLKKTDEQTTEGWSKNAG